MDDPLTAEADDTAPPSDPPPPPPPSDPPPPPPPSDPPPPPPASGWTPTTELGTALVKAKLADVAKYLEDAGFNTFASLGVDVAAVTANVKGAWKDAPTGKINQVVVLWQQQTKQLPVLDLPKLPEGAKIDLTQSKVTIDNVTYAIPTSPHANTDDGKPKAAVALNDTDWLVIVGSQTHALKGINLDAALRSTADNDAVADGTALVWKVTSPSEFLTTTGLPDTGSRTTMQYTSTTNSFVHNRIVQASLDVQTPFVSGAASASRNERLATSRLKRRLYLTARYSLPFAQLELPLCTAPSQAFTDAITTALGKPANEQFTALRGVFTRFGHVAPRYVTLGGMLYFTSDRETSGSLDDKKVETTVNAAVSAKAEGIAVGAKSSFQDGLGSSIDSQSVMEEISFTPVGGDITKADNPGQWADSTKYPNYWAIIGRRDLVSLVEWLDADTKQKVKDVWDAGLRATWGANPPAGYAMPDMEGLPFTIAAPTDHRLVRPNSIAGYPCALAAANLKAAALENGLGWQLVYSGDTTDGDGRGLPLYWIVEFQSDALAKARQQEIQRATAKNAKILEQTGVKDYAPIPSSRVALAAIQRGKDWYVGTAAWAGPGGGLGKAPESLAAWTIQPADPGRHGLYDIDVPYVLCNPASGSRVLGAVGSNAGLIPGEDTTEAVALAGPETDGLAAWTFTTH